MSKRKPRTKSMFVDQNDLVFEDDSDPELLVELNKPLKVSKSSQLIEMSAQQQSNDLLSTRVSSRAKKTKNIYDPSEYNGPVHKKKKEALEAAQTAAILKKQKAVVAAPVAVEAPTVKTPVKKQQQQQPKTPDKAQLTKSPTKIKSPPQITKAPPARIRTYSSLKNGGDNPVTKPVLHPPAQIQGILKPIHQVAAAAVAAASTVASSSSSSVPASPSKDPKRIRKEKLIPKVDYDAPKTTTIAQARRSASTSGNSEFERASTVELGGADGQRKIPDVSKWSSSDVYNYFLAQGFEEKDARVLKEQEIDGETLMILQRDDLKSLNLRIGIFIKMWNRILKFQCDSQDISLGWK